MDQIPTASLELRLLSYNIQAGAQTSQYTDYVTRGWQQVLPYRGRSGVVGAVGDAVKHYDIVGLQEADDGSLRSGFVNQSQVLAEQGRFPFWSQQTNRRVSRISRTCNALLSRVRPVGVENHRLPAGVPGRVSARGALVARYGNGDQGLTVANVHLALSRRARRSQLDFLADRLLNCEYAVAMGDFNAPASAPEMRRFLARTGLNTLPCGLHTFPSWRPARRLDHIFFSDAIALNAATVLALELSDHCPVVADVSVPVNAISYLPEISAPNVGAGNGLNRGLNDGESDAPDIVAGVA
ncbi:MAG: endonuclease/exonuclease/phosphatase family protein [Lysobacterales bacterium]